MIFLTALTGCGKHQAGHGKAESLPEAQVTVGTVEARTTVRTQALPGTVYPSDLAVIASKIMATIERVDVVIGEAVTEGQILIELDAGEIQAQVEQAEAALAQLERNYEREKGLLAQSATTAESVRTLEDEIRLARARLSEARIMQSYTQIRSPFDGLITSKEVRRGDLASPGVPLLTVEGKGSLEVHVDVPDSLMAVPYGDSVELQSGTDRYTGQLSEWSPAADPASRTRLAKLQLPLDSPLRSGQYVRVNWPAEEVRSLWIPASALSPMGQLERVFIVEDGTLELELIQTGMLQDAHVQVLAGLREGDRVVLSPSSQLRDGQPASILP
jgi:RND family efflux transporter MFP subunit